MFSYPDAARYRVGPNYQQLPCNAALSKVYSPYQRDGPSTINGNYGGDPDYVRSSFRPLAHGPKDVAHDEWVGKVQAYSSDVEEDDFVQARDLWKIMLEEEGAEENFLANVTGHMKSALPEVQKEAISELKLVMPPGMVDHPLHLRLTVVIDVFAKVDKDLARKIEEKLKA